MRPSSAGKLVGTMATETITVVFTDLVGSTVQRVRAGDLAVLEFGASATGVFEGNRHAVCGAPLGEQARRCRARREGRPLVRNGVYEVFGYVFAASKAT